jgi:molecular chaperone DnaJ
MPRNGGEPKTRIKKCDKCDGSGKIKNHKRTFLGSFVTTSVCDKCSGKGEIPEKPCSKCSGEGTVRDKAKIQLTIPAGISNGQTISIEGAGEPGQLGGEPGDLYVTVHVLRHDKFERKGDNIWYKAKIPFSSAALGDKIEIPTLSEKVRIKIPAGTSSGKIFRLAGEGVKKLRGFGKGDLMIEVVVDIPKRLSFKQKKLIKEMKEEGL